MVEEENGSQIEELDKQPAVNKGSHVKLKIKLNKKKEVTYFWMNRKSKIRKLLANFCKRASLDYRSTRFVIEHQYFSHDKTPNQLGLQEDDQIDALVDGDGA